LYASIIEKADTDTNTTLRKIDISDFTNFLLFARGNISHVVTNYTQRRDANTEKMGVVRKNLIHTYLNDLFLPARIGWDDHSWCRRLLWR
jgi:hypothetical protein